MANETSLVCDIECGETKSVRQCLLPSGYANAVLTPNAAEFRRLSKAVLGREDWACRFIEF